MTSKSEKIVEIVSFGESGYSEDVGKTLKISEIMKRLQYILDKYGDLFVYTDGDDLPILAPICEKSIVVYNRESFEKGGVFDWLEATLIESEDEINDKDR